jgi:transposase-like protein
MRRTYTASQRDELLRGVIRRGERVPEIAARLGVGLATAYKWVRAAATSTDEGTSSRPTFVELVPTRRRDARLVVRVGVAEIDVPEGFDSGLLRSVVEALGGAL